MKALIADQFPVNGHRIIEASAGTGKTYTITNLYLRLLLGDDDDQQRPLGVDEILVLTFTVAATEELRRRIRNRINQARIALIEGRSEDPFLDRLALQHPVDGTRLLTAALQLMDEASIFTIHGFCARVLTEQSFETGVLFDQELNADRDTLLHQAVEDCFRIEILDLPADRRAVALSLWSDPDSLETAIKGFLFRPNLTLKPAFQDLDALEKDLFERIRTVKQLWLEDDIPELLRSAGIHGGRRTITWIPVITEFCRSGRNDFDHWDPWTTATIRSNLNKSGEMPEHPIFGIIDSIYRDQQLYRERVAGNLWNRVIRFVRQRMDQIKSDLGELTLDDLLTRVDEALAQHEGGQLLARRLAARWPVAMVDEFQDTDDVQYQIFSRIYRRPGEQSLIFIGDPKQAIYQFRGADIYTYINAKRLVDPGSDLFSLDTNWRSTRPLIDAINRLFNQPDIFLNDRDIPFIPVKPSPEAENKSFRVEGNAVVPVTVFHIQGEAGPPNKDEARTTAMDHAAEEVARLLNLGRQGKASLDGEPLDAGQIAFLVRDRHDAREARAALRRRDIRSVYVTLESVFLSDTADDLRLILEAVIEPGNERALRAALATPLLQCTAWEIDALNHDVIHQQRILEEFLDYHYLWATHDVAPMVESLISRRRIAEKWLAHPDGERQLTNLRHLAELLQKRSDRAPGMHRLLKWFVRERADAETVSIEERQLRLESDQHLVQIVTMHAAKGLEYDVVMIPMAGFRSHQRPREPALFHETTGNGFRTVVDVNHEARSVELARTEKLAEDMRLLYVAITRAKYKCYVGIPNTADILDTAVAKLFNLDRTDGSVDAIEQHLEADFVPPLFIIQPVLGNATLTSFTADAEARPLIAPEAPPRVDDRWRLHSYTGIASLIPARESDRRVVTPIAGYGDDDQAAPDARRGTHNRFNFPRGPRVGIALHELFEQISFQTTREELVTICERTLNRIGVGDDREEWLDILASWVRDILDTPLAAKGRTFALADIGAAHRLAEMEFHFPLAPAGDVGHLLRQFNYLSDVERLPLNNLKGMMTGLIDLVVETDGRFYLIDYKSNYLGASMMDYEHHHLAGAITAHRYDLQYLIYCIALNRYLATRVADYSYQRDFGGVFYLFLRGMGGKDAPASGVYFDKPDAGLVSELDHLMGGAS